MRLDGYFTPEDLEALAAYMRHWPVQEGAHVGYNTEEYGMPAIMPYSSVKAEGG